MVASWNIPEETILKISHAIYKPFVDFRGWSPSLLGNVPIWVGPILISVGDIKWHLHSFGEITEIHKCEPSWMTWTGEVPAPSWLVANIQIFISFPWSYGNSQYIPRYETTWILSNKSLWNKKREISWHQSTGPIVKSLGPRPVLLPTFPVGSCVGKLSDCGFSWQKWGTNWSSTSFNHENSDLKHEDYEGIRRIQDISEYHWWMMVDD